jgi:hypothetical protein
MISQDLAQRAANDLEISSNTMPKLISPHALDDRALFVDRLGALHIGTCRNNRVMNSHLLDNVQRRPAHIDLIAANQQVRCPFHDSRSKPVTLQPICGGESCGPGP